MIKNRRCNFIFSLIFLALLGAFTSIAAQTKIDEYGDIKIEDEYYRLDNFSVQLKNKPKATGYIIVYGGRKSCPKDAETRGNRAKDFSVKERNIDPSRILVIVGGYKDDLSIELWIVPEGADFPNLSPTVDPSEVKPSADCKKGN